MRLAIREQLALLVLLCSLIAVAVLAIATWVQNYHFVVNIRTSSLALTASLKAAQAASDLVLFETSVRGVSTRVLVQSALQRYNNGNSSAVDTSTITSDISSALSGSGGNALMLQAVVFPKNASAGIGLSSSLLNVTGSQVSGTIQLPYNYPNGTPVYLGDTGLGYPAELYPNLTYTQTVVNSSFNSSDASFEGDDIGTTSTLVIGPYGINATFSILSMTMAIVNNTSADDILGFMTILVDARTLYNMVDSPEGLDKTGEVLLIGPDRADNKFADPTTIGNPASVSSQSMRFLLPPQNNSTLHDRHDLRAAPNGDPSLPFLASQYPAVVDAFTKNNDAINNAGALISTHNEQNKRVSAGYATLTTSLVDWVLVVEQDHDEVIAPIVHLRNILIACVFGTVGIIMIIVWPLAHVGVKPIRQLRSATKKTVEPYIPEDASFRSDSPQSERGFVDDDDEGNIAIIARKEGFLDAISRLRSRKTRRDVQETNSSTRRRTFRIPGKVPESRHCFQDELTDLTKTFNEMSDELVMQYERLEQRVKERTAELEQSKKAAEAANESKTLFIANISHELKTPLNGILGMCAVSMQDTDLKKIRQSLGVIYKSGDLLLHLLTDLLTFSKNSIGQQLSLDEKEFRLGDVSSQLLSIFEKQAKDGNINLKIVFQGPNDAFGNPTSNPEEALYGPFGTGRVKDMCLWGDKNRILQVLINLTSNSLKFTPANGVVEVRIRCAGLAMESPPKTGSRKGSVQSKQSKTSRPSKRRGRTASDKSVASSANVGSGSDEKSTPKDLNSTLSIKVDGETRQIPQVAVRQRSLSPPLNTKQLAFEFEVEDTGPGIPENQQQKVFEPFVQGDLGLTKKYGGTGLGLSICAQLAALMGGDIALNSTVGIGSTFCMRIPLRWVKERADSTSSSTFRLGSQTNSIVGQSLYDDTPKTPRRNGSTSDVSVVSDHSVGGDATYNSGAIDHQQPRLVGFSQPYFANPVQSDSPAPRQEDLKRAEAAAVKDGRKVRVLVAEDNQVNQQVVLRMLKLEEIYDVTVAKDGQVALDLVRASMENGERFDLIFMDIQMPNLDGIQSTKRIRDLGFNAPIVALTAFSEESNVKECLSSGMDDFMPKPIKRPQLKAVIKKYCATIPEEPDREKNASSLQKGGKSNKKVPPNGPVHVPGTEDPGSVNWVNRTGPDQKKHTKNPEGTDSEAVSPLS